MQTCTKHVLVTLSITMNMHTSYPERNCILDIPITIVKDLFILYYFILFYFIFLFLERCTESFYRAFTIEKWGNWSRHEDPAENYCNRNDEYNHRWALYKFLNSIYVVFLHGPIKIGLKVIKWPVRVIRCLVDSTVVRGGNGTKKRKKIHYE